MAMRKVPSLAVGVLVVLGGLGVRPALAVGSSDAGKTLARTWCASCHAIGNDDSAITSDQAPPFPFIAVNRTDDELRGFLSNPHPPMPPLVLARRDIDDLIAYIVTLRPPQPPEGR